MQPDLAVRRAEPADVEPAAALVAAAGLPAGGFAESWGIWVARSGGAVVGVAALERHGDAYLLRSVAVDPEARRAGIGAAVVRAVLAAVPAGAPVGLLTETAAGWFPRFGFVAVPWPALPEPLAASPELSYLCDRTAQAMLRT